MNEADQDCISYKSNQLALEFKIGSIFSSIQEFVDLFSTSAMTKGISFKTKQRNMKCVCFSCKDTICTFKVNAALKKVMNKCIVTKMTPFHSIDCTIAYVPSKAAIKAVISNANAQLNANELISNMRKENGAVIKYITAYKAIESYKISKRIVLKDSYSYINSLIGSLDQDLVYTKLDVNGVHFSRLFMSWKASKQFYDLNRKIIAVDGSFLSGPNKGTLLVAVAQDGKEQLVLLAFAIVESENLDSWKFFLENLNITFDIDNSSTILMSDRDLGLLSAANEITPNIIKCNCVRHIAKNLKTRFRNKTLIDKFWTLVYISDENEFDQIMSGLMVSNLDFYNALMSINPITWANSKCPIRRYGKNTSNSAESMNSMLKKYKSQDISNLIISINNFNMTLFSQRRAHESNDLIFKKQLKELESNVAISRLLSVQESNTNVFLVEMRFIVDFGSRKCSCKQSFEFGYPCRHLCAVILFLRLEPKLFIEQYFTGRNYNISYAGYIMPLTTLNLVQDELLPPEMRRSRGRPRISRFRSITEH